MINLPELFILDVGHGNCAILQDTDTVTVVDCPPTPIVIEVLERLGIDTIDHLLISHSDADHAGGIPNLLGNIFVQNVYVNPDAEKRGAKGSLWKGIRIALDKAEQEGTQIHTSLTSALSKKIHTGQVEIEILSPSSSMALGGVGGEDLDGRLLRSNSLSVVIGLVHKGYRIALLPGDMDEIGLDNLLKKQQNIEAHILVFPHHGGTPGTEYSTAFASKLCRLVQPRLVVFSQGRNRFNYPRPDIIEGVLLGQRYVHVMCTQLSKKCAIVSPRSEFLHLTNLPAAGRINDSCCGGTILVTINGTQTTYAPFLANHRTFITDKNVVPAPLCLKLKKEHA